MDDLAHPPAPTPAPHLPPPRGFWQRIGDRLANDLPPVDRQVAMVFQSFALFPWLTVQQNVELGLEAAGVAEAERAEADSERQTNQFAPLQR